MKESPLWVLELERRVAHLEDLINQLIRDFSMLVEILDDQTTDERVYEIRRDLANIRISRRK
mgnify:FL=1